MLLFLSKRALACFLDFYLISYLVVLLCQILHFSLLVTLVFRLIFLALYFIVLPFFWRNQTVFMKIFELRVSSITGATTIHTFSKRFFFMIFVEAPIFFSSVLCTDFQFTISQLGQAYIFAALFPLFLGKTRLSLWDQLSNSKVEDINNPAPADYPPYFTLKKFIIIFTLFFALFMVLKQPAKITHKSHASLNNTHPTPSLRLKEGLFKLKTWLPSFEKRGAGGEC